VTPSSSTVRERWWRRRLPRKAARRYSWPSLREEGCRSPRVGGLGRMVVRGRAHRGPARALAAPRGTETLRREERGARRRRSLRRDRREWSSMNPAQRAVTIVAGLSSIGLWLALSCRASAPVARGSDGDGFPSGAEIVSFSSGDPPPVTGRRRGTHAQHPASHRLRRASRPGNPAANPEERPDRPEPQPNGVYLARTEAFPLMPLVENQNGGPWDLLGTVVSSWSSGGVI